MVTPNTYTFAMLKSHMSEYDAWQTEEIFNSALDVNLFTRGMAYLNLTEEMAREFYFEERYKAGYPELIRSITSGRVAIAMLVGPNAVAAWNELLGHVNPSDAAPGTVRCEFGKNFYDNAGHGSACAASAARECRLFYSNTFIEGVMAAMPQ